MLCVHSVSSLQGAVYELNFYGQPASLQIDSHLGKRGTLPLRLNGDGVGSP